MAESTEATMADVARAAGVSLSTVSRALNGVAGVGAATRERVRREAERLNYIISPEASGLSRRSTGRIGVVVPGLNLWFHATMLAAIERTVRAAAMDLLIYQVEGAEERQRFFADLPARRRVDAVILNSLPLTPSEAARLADLNVDVVVAGGQILDYPSVRIDDVAAGRAAVDHLIALGHERIAMLTATDPSKVYWSSATDRSTGYAEGLAAAGLAAPDRYLVSMPYGAQGGRDGIRCLLALDDPPTAVIAYSDEMALGALRGLREAGVSVPEDMSLVGFDGHPMADLFGLTTIEQHIAEQGQIAGRLALDLLTGNPTEHTVLVDTDLVVRESTAPVGGGRPGVTLNPETVHSSHTSVRK